MTFFQQFLYIWFKLIKRIKNARNLLLESFLTQWLFENKSWIEILCQTNYALTQKKQQVLSQINQQDKTIFFVFREIHFLDWFAPIHLALEKLYPGQFNILYINYGSTLKTVGTGFKYLEYRSQIERRLTLFGISTSLHFSDREMPFFKSFPQPDLILTSETIRKESLTADHRVYIPHYTVPKAKDTLPREIAFNHVFLPTKPPYTYQEINENSFNKAMVHQVGYPKLHSPLNRKICLFENSHKTLIYAPSLEVEIILAQLKFGILKVFKSLPEFNFIIKLHPTISSKMATIRRLISNQIVSDSHIVIDHSTSIQDLGTHSSLLITDYGSVGAEYRLKFSKRVVYLDVPEYLHGGADLLFRDKFADGVTPIKRLGQTIKQVLDKGDLSDTETSYMIEQVLYSSGEADKCAAESIYNILNPKKIPNLLK